MMTVVYYDHSKYYEVYEIKEKNKDDITLTEKDLQKSINDREIDKKLFKHPDKSEDGRDLALTKQ